jgi:Cu2+-exporting ATPase
MIWSEENNSSKQILLSIEKQSEHPLAEAVVNYLKDINTVQIHHIESLTGKGVKANYKDINYLVGNQKLLTENQILIDNSLKEQADKWLHEAKTVIWFADDKKALAVLAIADEIKETSIEAIKELQKMGIEVHMLTGDNYNTAKAIAEKTGISSFKGEVLPKDKADFVKELQAKGKIVAMVGDGINDSTALAQANVSIAMGKGSDIAIDVAKMTIISSDLMKISTAIKLSKSTVNTIKQNLFWAFIYNVVGIPIAAGILYPINGFLLNPMIAGAAMALSSISVVGNSLRLKYFNN